MVSCLCLDYGTYRKRSPLEWDETREVGSDMNFPFHARERQPLEALLLVEKSDDDSSRSELDRTEASAA